MGRNITIREIYNAAEANGMLDAPIVITGCDVDWPITVRGFEVTESEIKVW